MRRRGRNRLRKKTGECSASACEEELNSEMRTDSETDPETNIASDEVIDFQKETPQEQTSSTAAILNILSSPIKRRDTRYFFDCIKEILEEFKCGRANGCSGH